MLAPGETEGSRKAARQRGVSRCLADGMQECALWVRGILFLCRQSAWDDVVLLRARPLVVVFFRQLLRLRHTLEHG